MKRPPLLFAALFALVLATGCDSESEPNPDTSDTTDTADTGTCTPQWEAATPALAGATATIADGVLSLAAPTIAVAPDNIATSWRNVTTLTGDFETTVTFRAFSPGGTGTFFQALVVDAATPGFYGSGGLGNVSAAYQLRRAFSAAVVPNVPYDEALHADVSERSENDSSGAIQFERVGAQLTVTTLIGGKVATRTSGFSTGPLTLVLQLGNNFPVSSVDGASSVEVTGVTGALTDTFDCNTLDD